jgi:hypothetical protein
MNVFDQIKNVNSRQDFINIEKKLNLKKISENEIMINEVDDIWDGPLSGECTWQNRKYYFYCFDQLDGDDDRWPRKYLLLILTKQQVIERQKVFDIYQDFCSGKLDQEEYAKILNSLPPQKFEIQQIVGWFDSGDHDNLPSKFIKSYFEWQDRKR